MVLTIEISDVSAKKLEEIYDKVYSPDYCGPTCVEDMAIDRLYYEMFPERKPKRILHNNLQEHHESGKKQMENPTRVIKPRAR